MIPSETTPKRFLVIDDHPLFCEALSLTLASVQEDCRIDTAQSLTEGLRAIDDETKPDAILLDLNLPDVEGVDGLTRLRDQLPDVPVVVISSHDDDRVIASVLKAGASGFISKQSSRNNLEGALQQIWAGETYVPPSFEPSAYASDSGTSQEDSVALLQTLTPQQGKILELVCGGMLNKQIAHEMSIAETTVKAHITAILRKLKVQSRTQAALLAQEARLNSVLREG